MERGGGGGSRTANQLPPPSLRGTPQEREQLEAAAADYRKAIELYGQVRGLADANRNVWFAQAWLRVVEKRIANLDDAGPQ